MANVLTTEKQILCLRMLVEGSSIGAVERTTEVHRDTILRLMVRRLGKRTEATTNDVMADLKSRIVLPVNPNVAMHIAYYNFCWQMRENGKKGGKRPTPAMQAGVSDRLWTFGELFETAMN